MAEEPNVFNLNPMIAEEHHVTNSTQTEQMTCRVRVNSGTRYITLAVCKEGRAETWIKTVGSMQPWARRTRIEINGQWWHVLVIETNTGKSERGIRWPSNAEADEPCYHKHCAVGSDLGNEVVSWICESCGESHQVKVEFTAQSSRINIYDLVVDLGTARSSAVIIDKNLATTNTSACVAPLPFWPMGYSGDAMENCNISAKTEQYSIIPSVAFLYPHLVDDKESVWGNLLHSYAPETTIEQKGLMSRLFGKKTTVVNGSRITMRPIMFLKASPLLLSAHSKRKETSSLWNQMVTTYSVGSSIRSLQPAPKRYISHAQEDTWGFPPQVCNGDVSPIIARIMHTNNYDWKMGQTEEMYLPEGTISGSWNFPRSGSLIWYCLSIIEQAWSQIQTDWIIRYFEGDAVDPATIDRKLGEVVATVPPGWPPKAKQTWREAWKRAIDIFTQVHLVGSADFETPPQFSNTYVDESFAAQFPFVSALIEGGSESLVNLCQILCKGRKNAKAFRVMTLDIGGGTSDLSICKYTLTGEHSIDVKTELAYSSSIAGDEVVFELLQRVIIPKRLEVVEEGDIRQRIRDRLADQEYGLEPGLVNRHRNQCFLVFPSMAHLLLQKMAENPHATQVTITAKETEAGKGLEFIKTFETDGLTKDDLGPDEMTIDVQSAMQVILETLEPVLDIAAKQIATRQVDLVLLSGKLTEISGVSDKVIESLPITPGRIIRAGEAVVSAMFPSVWRKADRRVLNSKCLVPAGAAMAHVLQNTTLPNSGVTINFSLENASQYDWGFHCSKAGRFTRFFKADSGQDQDICFFSVVRAGSVHLRLRESEIEIPLQAGKFATIVRRFPSGEPEPIYKLTVDEDCEEFVLIRNRNPHGEDIQLDPSSTSHVQLVLDMLGNQEHRHERMEFPEL